MQCSNGRSPELPVESQANAIARVGGEDKGRAQTKLGWSRTEACLRPIADISAFKAIEFRHSSYRHGKEGRFMHHIH